VVAVSSEHLGPERAARYLRKFYPWYLERLGAEKPLAAALQKTDELDSARALIGELALAKAVA
jgi:tRNA-dihydrouridine synthase B